MRYLKNLSSTETFGDIKPWEFTHFERVPEECLKDKAKRDAWINHPETDFHVYNYFEGTQDNLRLHSESSKQDENPPAQCWGLAPDYDVPTTLEDVKAAMRIMEGPLPNYFEETLSGHGRLHWIFEKPVRFPSRKFALAWLKKIDSILPIDRLPGIDRPALLAPERYYTNGCRWHKLSSILVSENHLRGYMMRIAEKFDWTTSDLGKVAVSMERIAEECRKKYPKFREWTGDFSLGAVGPTFWVEGSTSPKSAIIHETGIHTFSNHAHKSFFPWAELVGSEFVERSEDEFLGKATKDIYYDGKHFFLQGPGQKILCNDPTVMRRHLVSMKGISDKKPKEGGPAMVDKALSYIEHHQRIDGASSCAFFPHGVFKYNNNLILNTHKINAIQPVPNSMKSAWGPGGKFPFLSAFTDQFLTKVDAPVEQKNFLLAWLQYFYRCCYARDPRSGHGVVIAGPVNVGKTFFNRGVIGGLVGGSAEANAYILGTDPFNSELFDHALWVVDDGSVNPSATTHRLYTEAIKRIVANREHRVNEKYRKAVQTPWQGRIVITLNDDPVSISAMPAMDGSTGEKLLVFRAGPRTIDFRSQPEMEKILRDELPYLANWLLEWKPPDYVLIGSDPRFGIMSYCEPTLFRTSNLSSNVSSFAEILSRWLAEYFRENPSATFWMGSAIDLRLSMSANPAFAEALRGYKLNDIPRMLLQLHDKKMFKMTVTETDNERHFRIECEDRFRKPGKTETVPQAVGSIFEKP